MNPKTIGIAAAIVVVAAGIGYTIANPEVVAGLADDLTGAVATRDGYPRVAAVQVAIDGTTVSGVKSFTGCGAIYPPSSTTKTTVPTVRSYEPCVLTLRGSPNAAVRAWIADTIEGVKPTRQLDTSYLKSDGTVAPGDRLHNVLITGFEMSTLDASSSEEVVTKLTLLAERLERGVGSAGGKGASTEPVSASAFMLTAPGLPESDLVRVTNLSFSAPARDVTTTADSVYRTYAPGPVTFSQVGVRFVIPGDKSGLSIWESETANGGAATRDLTIALLDRAGVPVLRIDLLQTRLTGFETSIATDGSMLRLADLDVQPARLGFRA